MLRIRHWNHEPIASEAGNNETSTRLKESPHHEAAFSVFVPLPPQALSTAVLVVVVPFVLTCVYRPVAAMMVRTFVCPR